MTDISTLLKEAKPLYFTRKKRRRQMRAAGFGCACLLAAYLMVPFGQSNKYVPEMESLYAYLYEPVSMDAQIGGVQKESWDSYIPIDEYGLVAVL